MTHHFPRPIRRQLVLATACLVSAAGAHAQASPNADTSRLTLPPLHLESLVFDSDRGRLVLFGGSSDATTTRRA